MSVGISLGSRCEAAQIGIEKCLRQTKQNGNLTCPFDLCNTNYIGLCKCLEDDFKHFFDLKYLALKTEPQLDGILPSQTNDQLWIYNSYYGMAFNHESPGHGNLYSSENWEGGINHFVSNNFLKFIERYTNRITNFYEYLRQEKLLHIDFLLLRYNSIPYELEEIIKRKFPNLNFTIHCFINFTQNSIDFTTNKNRDGIRDFEIAYLKYFNVNEEQHPEEYARFYREFDATKFQNIASNHIKIYY